MADGEGRGAELHLGAGLQLVLQRARRHVVDEVVGPGAELDPLDAVICWAVIGRGGLEVGGDEAKDCDN